MNNLPSLPKCPTNLLAILGWKSFVLTEPIGHTILRFKGGVQAGGINSVLGELVTVIVVYDLNTQDSGLPYTALL